MVILSYLSYSNNALEPNVQETHMKYLLTELIILFNKGKQINFDLLNRYRISQTQNLLYVTT